MILSSSRATWLALLLVASVFSPPSAEAQKRGLVGALLGAGATAVSTGALSGSEAAKTYGPNDLRPEVLTTCMISAYRLDESEAALDKVAVGLEKESASIDKEQAALARDGKREFTEQADVDKYNAHARAQKARVAAYNAKIESYNERRVARKKGTEAFNGQCAGKRYYPSDLAAIQGQLPFDPAKYSAKK